MTDVRTDTVPVRPAGRPARRYRGGRAGAVALVLSALLSQELGAASAVQLFPRVGAPGVASLRLAISAALLLAVARPRIRGRSRADWALIGAYGVTTATMNMLFYQAIARIPLVGFTLVAGAGGEYGTDNPATPRKRSGRNSALVHAIGAPQSWPITVTGSRPSCCTRPTTSPTFFIIR